MEYIDNELLIFEVSKHEVLYNKSNTESDRASRQEAWMQICKVLVENETSPDGWEKMDPERKTWICKQVTQRWKSLKDAFAKYVRSEKEQNGIRKKAYYYSRRMAFLLPYLKCNQTSENTSENEEKEQTLQPSTSTETVQFNNSESSGSVEWMNMPLAERLEAGDLLELELVEETEGRNQATHETQPILENSNAWAENQQFIQPNFSTESGSFSEVLSVSPPKRQKVPEVMRIPPPKRQKIPEVKLIPSPKRQKEQVRGDHLNVTNMHASTSSGQENLRRDEEDFTQRPKKGKNGRIEDEEALKHEVLLSVRDHFNRPQTQEDRHDIFAKNISFKLRNLPHQRLLIAEKIINDCLYLAETGILNATHRIVDEAVPTHYNTFNSYGIPFHY